MYDGINSKNKSRWYQIGGYILRSTIPDVYLRSNFADYEINPTDDILIDLLVRTCIMEEENSEVNAILRNKYNLKRVDKEKFYGQKDSSYIYYYSKYSFVESCELVIQSNHAILSINLKSNVLADLSQDQISFDFMTEVTYAFRDGVYTFLCEKGDFCFHACGFVIDGKGILIAGSPGSGKSTLSKEFENSGSITYVGEDINICKIKNGKLIFAALPWCRINNNIWTEATQIIFLGNEVKSMDKKSISDELLKSEFAMIWLPHSLNTIQMFTEIMACTCQCTMKLAYKKD